MHILEQQVLIKKICYASQLIIECKLPRQCVFHLRHKCKHDVTVESEPAFNVSLFSGNFPQGVISLKKTDMDCYYVFVKTPSIEELVCDQCALFEALYKKLDMTPVPYNLTEQIAKY